MVKYGVWDWIVFVCLLSESLDFGCFQLIVLDFMADVFVSVQADCAPSVQQTDKVSN